MMQQLTNFTQSLGFIVAFLIMVLLLALTVGEKATTMFLWLVLLSMALLNSSSIIQLTGRFSGK
ncbi:hypothetical protein MKY96_33820 [Paenibacillus sp. FSL R7-0302]|uniref:hypothetical protein n=1 Tax=Paenibacillus sp. FSL R7-0302 TaxID=2921681 RepID=UPI0030FA2988